MAVEIEQLNTGQEVAMQKLMKMIEDMMVAITFAEAGEYDAKKPESMSGTAEDRSLAADSVKA
jgi:hypothetical protein